MVRVGEHGFDASQHKPVNPEDIGGPLPENGWYAMKIVKGEYSDYAAEDLKGSQMLTLTFEVMPEFHPTIDGAKVFSNYNLYHPKSAKAREIAAREIAQISQSVGVPRWEDTAQIENRPIAVKVKTVTYAGRDGEPKKRSEIAAYDSLEARKAQLVCTGKATPAGAPPAQQQAAPASAAPAATPPPQGQPGQSQTPPWQQPQG